MPDTGEPAICGSYCGTCRHLSDGCDGRDNVKEKPFWTELVGVGAHPTYDGCVNRRHLGNCGHCSELLCGRYAQIKDPLLTE